MSNSVGNEGFGYWMKWQVPVCALIIILPTILALIFVSKVKKAPLSVYDMWVPCWRGFNPLWLLIYRASVLVIMASLLYLEVSLRGAFSFYFYTQWTFALVMIYFALGTVVSARGCWGYLKSSSIGDEETDGFLRRELEGNESTYILTSTPNKIRVINRPENHDEHEIEAKAGYLEYLMQTVYQVCAGAAILTDIVFWCILVPFLTSDSFRLTPLMGFMHSFNVVFLLLDTSLSNLGCSKMICNNIHHRRPLLHVYLPFPWFRLAYFVFYSCIYIIFQWVLHACGFTWWPYAFLELSTPWAPLWYFALALVHIPCYGAYVSIVKAKNSAFSRLFPHAYVSDYHVSTLSIFAQSSQKWY